MKKLDKKWKLFVYAASGLGVNMLNLMMGSYLCSALIAGGFSDEAKPFQTYIGSDLVIASVWAVFVVIAKILDGVIDVPMASFTDRLKTRFGRRRPSLLIGLIPMVIAYLLFLVIPDPSGISLLNTIYYGVVLCVFFCSYTLTMVTYYATFTEIVETEGERNIISSVKSFFDIVYFILGYVVVRSMLNNMNIRLVALLVLPIVLTMLIPMFMIKEPSNLNTDVEVEKAPKMFKSLAYTFKNKTFVIWMVIYAFMTMGVQLFLGGINEYFSTVGLNMMLVMIASFAPVPFTLILYNHIFHKKGFGFAFRYTLILFSVGMVVLFGISFITDPTIKTVASVVAGIISSFAIGSMFSVAYSIPSQLAAEEEKETGISHSAMYFAVQGLFAGVATGIATGIILTALKKTSESYADGALSPMWFLTVISAAASLISLILCAFLPKYLNQLGKDNK